MTSSIEAIWQEIETAEELHEFGGAVALIQHRGEIVLHKSIGWAVREPEAERTEMTLDTIFDLASITKVIATTPAVLQLIAQGKVELDEPISTYIPEFGAEGPKRDITIRNLLTHSSGIASWCGIYTQGTGIDAYVAGLAADQPEAEPNTRVTYSCMGFILLGEMVRRVSGLAINEYAAQHVFAPLGMKDTSYLPSPDLRDRIAATELGNDHEHPMAGTAPVSGWRDYLLRGEVHDGNAWYGLDGISGNAGAFGTADDLLRYATMWLNGGELDGVRILPEEIVEPATREQTGLSSPNERRGFGWQMVPHPDTPEEIASGRGLSSRAFGHTGFTGTSMWIDPERELISILLTNRVHPKFNMAWAHRRARISQILADGFPAK